MFSFSKILRRPLVSLVSLFVFLLVFVVSGADAGVPKSGRWEFFDRADFAQSKIEGFEVTFEGRLKPGVSTKVTNIPADYIWSLVEVPGGVYAGTGDGARIYYVPENAGGFKTGDRTDTTGILEVWSGDGLEIYALAKFDEETLYAGVSPDGTLLELKRNGIELEVSESIDVPDSYIWELMVVGDAVWLATGSGEIEGGGGVYRYKDGVLKKIYTSSDGHVLCLAYVDGRIYAGTEGEEGVVLQIDAITSERPRASVVYDPPEREIVDIIIGTDDFAYIIAAGDAQGGKDAFSQRRSAEEGDAPPSSENRTKSSNKKRKKTAATIYRLDAGGKAEEWILAKSHVRTAALSPFGFLVGTAVQGNVYRIDDRLKSTLLLTLDEDNVLSLSEHYIGAGDPAALYKIVPPSEDAFWKSEVLDAGGLTTWGVVSFQSEGSWEVRTRSGNSRTPNSSWSGWSLPIRKSGGRIESSSDRYLQFEVLNKDRDPEDFISEVALSYQLWNRPPRVNSVSVKKISFEKSKTSGLRKGGPLGQLVAQLVQAASNMKKKDDNGLNESIVEEFLQPFAGLWKIEWDASDPDDDALAVDIFLIDEESSRMVEISKDYQGELYLLNSRNFPDGKYRVQISVTDDVGGTSMAPRSTESSKDESRTFLIDNSAPEVVLKVESVDTGEVVITGTAVDELGYIASLYYFDEDNKWKPMLPDDGICDQPKEYFRFVRLDTGRNGNRSIIVKAIDKNGNIGFARINY